MIKINLIPKNLRKEKKEPLWGGLSIPFEILLGAVGFLVVLLMGLHILFVGINTARLMYYKALQSDWNKIQQAKKEIDGVLDQKKDLEMQVKKIKGLVGVRKFLWSEKLNLLSDQLPKGVWLTEINFSEKKFSIKGSAVSRQKTSMTNIHNYLSILKKDAIFSNQFISLDLGSIQRRMIGKVEVADFLMTAQLNKND